MTDYFEMQDKIIICREFISGGTLQEFIASKETHNEFEIRELALKIL